MYLLQSNHTLLPNALHQRLLTRYASLMLYRAYKSYTLSDEFGTGSLNQFCRLINLFLLIMKLSRRSESRSRSRAESIKSTRSSRSRKNRNENHTYRHKYHTYHDEHETRSREKIRSGPDELEIVLYVLFIIWLFLITSALLQ